ncbi:Hint domain-containing protein [Antarctobacter sp.]|uniref:Hint domain-containing protein n=1 Tax=Antarctobacter sp. TaxID=1872577 RepID=UPI003A902466
MATYTIVSSSKQVLDPGEIHAGTTMTPAEGDVFIISSDADGNVNFSSTSSTPTNFTIQVDDSNANSFQINVGNGLTPKVVVADNVNMSNVDFAASHSNPVTLVAGNGVTMGKFDGSEFNDVIRLGDDFTATGDWNMHGGNDSFVAGDNADFTASKLKGGAGNDTIKFGKGARFSEIDAESGNDRITLDDNASGEKIVGGSGNDNFWIGAQSRITKVDGGAGDDTLTTQTGRMSTTNVERHDVICFAEGTRIATPVGWVPVEKLRPGAAVFSRDHGTVPLRWTGVDVVSAQTLRQNRKLRPIRITAGALGPGIPQRDLVVSPQHRILVASAIAMRLYGAPEILVPANKLLPLPGVRREPARKGTRYYHLLFDRHEVILAEHAAAESLLVTPASLGACPLGVREEIRAALRGQLGAIAPARPIIQRKQALRDLFKRHRKNGKPFQTISHSGPLAVLNRSANPCSSTAVPDVASFSMPFRQAIPRTG